MSESGPGGRNPFEPPRAPLEPTPAAPQEGLFFSTSPVKLTVLSIATFSLYTLYWFYRNFQAIKQRKADRSMPFWRAFFAPLWAYSCFRDISDAGAATWGSRRGQAGTLAFVYFVLNMLSRLPDPYWLVSLVSFTILFAPNAWARSYNLTVAPDLEENARFSAANWIWIVVGGLFIALVLLGLFLPPPQ